MHRKTNIRLSVLVVRAEELKKFNLTPKKLSQGLRISKVIKINIYPSVFVVSSNLNFKTS